MVALLLLAVLNTPHAEYEIVTELAAAASPKRVPLAVFGLVPTRVTVVKDEWARGFHTVRWEYTIRGRSQPVDVALRADFRRDPGGLYVRQLPDRVQTVAIYTGRWLRTSDGTKPGWKHDDTPKYVTLDLSESVNGDGPLPTNWERRAVSAKPLVPVPALGLPSLGQPRVVSQTSSITYDGGIVAYVNLSVPLSAAEVRKRIEKDIARGAPWKFDGVEYSTQEGRRSWWWRLSIGQDAGKKSVARCIVSAAFSGPGMHFDWKTLEYVTVPVEQPPVITRERP